MEDADRDRFLESLYSGATELSDILIEGNDYSEVETLKRILNGG